MLKVPFIPLLRGTLAFALLAALNGVAHAASWDSSVLTPGEISARYGDPRDAITLADAEELMLRMVNAAREAAGSPPVSWSNHAAELAQEHADAMAEGRFGAHLDLRGRNVALRAADLGATDYVAENVVYYEVDASVALTPELLWSMLEDWVRSRSHFATLRRWEHTHVGFALSIVREDGRSYVAGVQEFITDLGDYDRLPENVEAGEELLLTGMLLPGRIEMAGVGLGYIDQPEAQTAQALNEHGGLPPASHTGDDWLDKSDVVYDIVTGEFSAVLRIPRNLRGRSAWVTVWAKYEDQVDGPPFCVMSQVVAVE